MFSYHLSFGLPTIYVPPGGTECLICVHTLNIALQTVTCPIPFSKFVKKYKPLPWHLNWNIDFKYIYNWQLVHKNLKFYSIIYIKIKSFFLSNFLTIGSNDVPIIYSVISECSSYVIKYMAQLFIRLVPSIWWTIM